MKKDKKKVIRQLKDISEKDWCGLIAIFILVGSFIVIIISILTDNMETIAGGIFTLMYAVTDWYFKAKANRRSNNEQS